MKNNPHPFRTLAALSALFALTHLAGAQTIWMGTNNITVDTNWSSAANWSTAAVPGSSDTVILNDGGTTTAPGTINNVVDGSTSIGSLQYANASTSTHTTLLLPGVTLTISGPGLTNGTETANDTAKTNTITGAGGAVVINNTSGNLVVRQGGVSAATGNRTVLNMAGLDTFNATVARVIVGVGTGGGQNRATGRLILAKTNSITASSTTVPAFDVGESGSNNGAGSSVWLGQTNAIFANTITVDRAKESGSSMSFNVAFPNAAALFRAADGVSRITTFAISDGGSGSGTFGGSGTVDLSGGTVDMLVDSFQVARANSNTGSTVAKAQTGTLTIKQGILDVNTLQIGINTAANQNWGQGTMNVNGPAVVVVNTALELGRSAAANSADNTRGVLNISNGGTVRAATLNANFGSTNSAITMTNATLVISNVLAGASGLKTFTFTNSTLQVAAIGTSIPSLTVTNLAIGGTTNVISIGSIPVVGGYPAQFPLIAFTTRIGATNFGLGSLPFNVQPYQGYLSNNTASIDLVVTNGPAPARSIAWNGTPTGDWDVATTANWKTNGNPTIFNQTDFVQFDDTASGTTTVNLTGPLFPSSVTISNNNKAYTFSGGGKLSGTVGVTKLGTGTATLTEGGGDDFTGGLTVNGGTLVLANFNTTAGGAVINGATLQVGSAIGDGNLPTGGVTDNGSLVFNCVGDITVNNVISGSGTITKNNANNTLTLTAANTFTGAVTVAQGTLRVTNNAALGATNGATTIASGATLDLSAPGANALNLGLEPIIVSGTGVGAGGAIINSGALGAVAQQNAVRVVTLAGDTTFGGAYRWDIRGTGATLSTGGNAYNITKIGANQVSLVAVSPIDAMLGNIDIQEGIFAVQTTTAQLGDPNKTITIYPNATLDIYNLNQSPLNKNITVQDQGIIFGESGRSIVTGPVTLQGYATINVGNITTSPSLIFSNTVSGPGNLNKIGAGTLILSGVCSYVGGTTNTAGTVLVNGTLNGDVLYSPGGSIGGSGTINPLADVSMGLLPGGPGSAGTLTAAGGLILEAGAIMTNDLAATTEIGGGTNDLLVASGGLTLNNNQIYINPLGISLQSGGTYRLVNYSGTMSGSFDPNVQQVVPTRYTFTLDQATPNQVNLTVSGNPANLRWAANNFNLAWDVAGSQNWVLPDSTPAVFDQFDTVLFDDTIGVSNTVVLGTAVIPAVITNNSSAGGNNFTLTGPGKISGSASIVKKGTSTLTLGTTNDFTGAVNILAGTLKLGCTNALGTADGPTIIASGATLDVGYQSTADTISIGSEQIFVSGAGVNGLGAIINTATNSQQNSTHFVTLLGDTTFGGPGDWSTTVRPGRWDIRGLGSSDIATNTSAFLSTSNQPYNLTKVGSNWVGIVGVQVDPSLANISILQGLMSFEHATTLGDPTKSLIVTNGATAEFWQNGPSNLLNKNLVLYGDGTHTNLVNGAYTNVFIGPVTLNNNCVFHMATNAPLLMSGVIGGDINCALSKFGPGTLFLSGANTFSGGTVINAGTLALTNTGSLNNSVTLTVMSGATLDAHLRADNTLALVSGQTLQGNGTVNGLLAVNPGAYLVPGGSGPLTVLSNITLAGTTSLQLDASTPTNDLVRCTAPAGTITYGGTLDLVNVAIPLTTNNSFKIFSAASYAGAFANLTPATPGSGLLWNTNTLAVDGTLRIASVSTVNPNPTNIVAVLANGQLQLSWPADHIGWDLQTNSVGLTATDQWFTLPSAKTTNKVFITPDPTKTNVFFRMLYHP